MTKENTAADVLMETDKNIGLILLPYAKSLQSITVSTCNPDKQKGMHLTIAAK